MALYAFVFPGQGSQSVGMGVALAAASSRAASVFAAADLALAASLSELIRTGPADVLDQTENSQPALLATSIAFLTELRAQADDAGVTLQPQFLAGHSMGQYSALVAGDALGFDDGIRLVRERGRLMQGSGAGRTGAMAAIIGLDDEHLPELVARASAHGLFEVANRNAPGQVVVSGERAAVDASLEIARELGARKVVLLPISIAAHSPLMADAAAAMAVEVAATPMRDPIAPLLSNAGARPITTAAGARRELVDHLTAGVDWVAAVEAMAGVGVNTFIEVGPGRVLSGLIKRIAPEARALPLDDPNGADGLSAAAVEAVLTANQSREGIPVEEVARA